VLERASQFHQSGHRRLVSEDVNPAAARLLMMEGDAIVVSGPEVSQTAAEAAMTRLIARPLARLRATPALVAKSRSPSPWYSVEAGPGRRIRDPLPDCSRFAASLLLVVTSRTPTDLC